MIFSNKFLLGGAALVIATAASFPHEIGERYFAIYSQDTRMREALRVCQQSNPEFVRFLASERDACFNQVRGLGMPSTYSGVWSKPDRSRM